MSEAPTPLDLRGRKILVVDDSPLSVPILSAILRPEGYDVTEVGSGEAALDAYPKIQPDLVLLDINMPRDDSLETLRRLMQLDPHCIVIMLTSLVNRQTVEECLRLGAADYLRKDTPPDEIIAQLNRIIDECFGDEPA